MISVFQFAGGSCDSTNVFGHAAIVFSGLGPDSFAISQMKGDGSNPTWHNSEGLIEGINNQRYATRTDQWESHFFSSRENHAFPMVVKKAYIISSEDLARKNYSLPLNWTGLSERKAFNWWKSVLQTEWNMPRALKGADCTDTVIRAIRECFVDRNTCASERTLTRPAWTPNAAVEYAQAINESIIRMVKLKDNQIQEIVDEDRGWRHTIKKIARSEEDLERRQLLSE